MKVIYILSRFFMRVGKVSVQLLLKVKGKKKGKKKGKTIRVPGHGGP
jgi:hypothetical protein